MRIIVDAMGGDNAPLEMIKGSALAVENLGVEVLLCGNEALIKKLIADNGISDKGFFYKDTGDCVIEMEDHADVVVKSKKDSSMGVGLQLLSDGMGDMLISAGSTGALIVGSTLIVKRIKGIKRPALGTVLPTRKNCSLLIDCGANVECKPEYFEQFGIMGSAYMEKIMGVKSPKVGLLNNGTESTKGTSVHIDANKLMAESEAINFTGNIEGRDAVVGEADVIVADGFSGNILLKTYEGAGITFLSGIKDVFYSSFINKLSAAVIKKSLKSFMKRYDYTEYGGAPIIGVNGVVIKAHGSSDAKSFYNAIRQGVSMVESEIINVISDAVSKK